VSVAVEVAGSCNAILRRDDGSLYGEMFDGAGFTRGARHKGFDFANAACLVVGTGGVGSAIAAAIATEYPRLLALYDVRPDAAESLASRLQAHYPKVRVELRDNDPAGYDLVVNATALGMRADDPSPFDPARLDPATFVGDVVLKPQTPLLAAAGALGCPCLVGTDMLFAQIPAYLEFFGYGTTTPEELREVARISY
jgi:shikimate dehydrogenase